MCPKVILHWQKKVPRVKSLAPLNLFVCLFHLFILYNQFFFFHMNRAHSCIHSVFPQLLLISEQPVVLTNPIGSGYRIRFDLPAAHGDGKIGDE